MNNVLGRLNIRVVLTGLALVAVAACNQTGGSGNMGNMGNSGNGTASAGEPAPAAKHAPNPSRSSPPSAAFAQFERIDAGRFHSTQQFTVFNAAAFPGSVDSIQYNYIYTDDRFAGQRSYDTDVNLQIIKFESPERAQAYLANAIRQSIPLAQAGSVRLPSCRGEKSASDDFVGPSKLVRTLPNPRGGEITILHSGDFNMFDCTRGSNRTETAIWVEGEYYFLASAGPMPSRPNDNGEGRAQDLAVDYTRALGPRG